MPKDTAAWQAGDQTADLMVGGTSNLSPYCVDRILFQKTYLQSYMSTISTVLNSIVNFKTILRVMSVIWNVNMRNSAITGSKERPGDNSLMLCEEIATPCVPHAGVFNLPTC